MNQGKFVLFVFIAFVGFINAQEEKDTIFLHEIEVVGKPKFEDKTSKTHFNWLEKRVLKVYPIFSELYADYKIVKKNLDSIKSKKQRKIYLHKKDDEFNLKHKKKIMSLTHTEGRILSKLMHKYTEKTSFELIKDFKGVLYSNFVNFQAKFVSIDLKEPFDPEKTREDAYIKTILNLSFANGTLIEVQK